MKNFQLTTEYVHTSFIGRIVISDAKTGEIVLDHQNAIHPQNMATAIGRALSNDTTGIISKMAFGTGGSFYNSGATLIFRTPNTVGNATLYNQTYSVSVDEQNLATPTTNSVISSGAPSPSTNTIITVTVQLGAAEPAGQAAADNTTTNPEAPYVFDEIGLLTSDSLLLSHLIFTPIEKTANRAFLITYTLTVSVS
jgi:hypothetical protein